MTSNDTKPPGDNLKPDPPAKPRFLQALLLFIYHIALALFLAYAVYNVWPPQPWPGDESSAKKQTTNTNSQAADNTNRNSPLNTNSEPATTTNTNLGNVNTGVSETTNTNSSIVKSAAGSPAHTNAKDNQDAGGVQAKELPPPIDLFGMKFQPRLEVRLLFLVMLVGALGAYVHAASSLVDYLGNRTFVSSWIWWYVLRPFIGMMLALIFYFVFRAGFVSGGLNASADPANFINPFGVAALAGLVGMFSKVASDKLNEVFTTLFRPAPGEGDAKRGDKLSGAAAEPQAPAITGVDPPTLKKGQKEIKVVGTNFVDGAAVQLDGSPRETEFEDATTLLVRLMDTDATSAGKLLVTVVNPEPGGGTSTPFELKVEG